MLSVLNDNARKSFQTTYQNICKTSNLEITGKLVQKNGTTTIIVSILFLS